MKRGREFDVVMLSRHYVAAQHIDTVRAVRAHARVVFDTVDLHFLREERLAELDGGGRGDDLRAHQARRGARADRARPT